MRIVKNRSKATLLSIIKEYVLPKTTIITDCYVSYHDLQNLEGMEYLYYSVNPNDAFKDPITGAHTNMIEGTWAHCKRHVPKLGLHKQFLDGYLCRFIWFKLVKSQKLDPFLFLLQCRSEQYQVDGKLANLVQEQQVNLQM
jgi:hypothetical protein